MPSFSNFDTRRYRTVDVRAGYAGWAATYGQSALDAMDIDLLERLTAPPWPVLRHAVDIGCGAGRTSAWLRGRGVVTIDGVDLTPEMLATARARRIERHLVEAPVAATELPASACDLVTVCLVDEHLPDLQPLYDEARRLAVPGALLMLVGYHPRFIMASGMPTHYTNPPGEPLAIETRLHLLSDHPAMSAAAAWSLAEMREQVIDDAWVARKPT